jgi:hypothetical protein
MTYDVVREKRIFGAVETGRHVSCGGAVLLNGLSNRWGANLVIAWRMRSRASRWQSQRLHAHRLNDCQEGSCVHEQRIPVGQPPEVLVLFQLRTADATARNRQRMERKLARWRSHRPPALGWFSLCERLSAGALASDLVPTGHLSVPGCLTCHPWSSSRCDQWRRLRC